MLINRNKIKKKWAISRFLVMLLLIVLLFAASLAYSIDQSAHTLSVSKYTLTSSKLDSSIRIVQLSDIHNSEFGDFNEDLISLVSQQSPDLILVTGDTINADNISLDCAVNLFQKLAAIAPLYVSMGNHEMEYEENYSVELTPVFESAGAVVLDFAWEDIQVGEQKLRLGGIYGYCLPEKYLKTGEARVDECEFLKEFQSTDLYTLLMCHMPVCWMINGALDEWDVDCVMAGHVHGGQIRIPFIGGLYGPDLGWFPGKLSGVYQSKGLLEDSSEKESAVQSKTKSQEQVKVQNQSESQSDLRTKYMVLSRGLGNTEEIPRINNIPEVVVLDLLP